MTIRKVRGGLAKVELRMDIFYTCPTREHFHQAVQEIYDFNRDIGIMLWDEVDRLNHAWSVVDREVKNEGGE